MGASPQTPGVYRMGPMGRKLSGIELPRRDGPVAAALRHEAPLAKSAVPVALQQSRILRMTLQGRQTELDKQTSPFLTAKNKLVIRPNCLQKTNESVTYVVGQFVTHVPVRTDERLVGDDSGGKGEH
jgi:hypothetical protein